MPITIDQLDEAHARAALDVLEGDGGLTVYEGSVGDNPTPPYVLVYTSVSWPTGEGQTFDGVTSRCDVRWTTHCVGASDASFGRAGDQSARTVSNRVRQLLVNVHPTITGRSCGLIQQDSPATTVRNETAGGLVMSIAVEYVLTTYPG